MGSHQAPGPTPAQAGEQEREGGGSCDLHRVYEARCVEGLWLFLCSGLADALQLNYKNKFKGRGAPHCQASPSCRAVTALPAN
eukprot:scaffold5294_cov15-Prasinocladus_malaysianus.AAC.1